MSSKTTAKQLAEMKARHDTMQCKLEEAQCEADWEEADWVHKECNKKEHEEAAKAKKQAEEAEDKHMKKAVAVCIAKYEARAKMLVPTGEPIVALGSDSEIESRVRLLEVTDLVSEASLSFFF